MNRILKKTIKFCVLGAASLVVLAVIAVVMCRTVFKDQMAGLYNSVLFDERVELLKATEFITSSVDSLGFSYPTDSVKAESIR